MGFTENSPTFEIMKALVETHKKHKKSGLKANDKHKNGKTQKDMKGGNKPGEKERKQKFESMEKVGLQRNLASHLG